MWPQHVEYGQFVVGEHDVAAVVQLQDHVVGRLAGPKLQVHYTVNAQLPQGLEALVL